MAYHGKISRSVWYAPEAADMTATDTTKTFADKEFPELPYPGTRPECSFVHAGANGWPLIASGTGWHVGVIRLDEWLTRYGAPPLTGRLPVLAYGSNACPQKITWLRTQCELPGPVVVLAAWCVGIAAVWATGVRARDGQRPATLAAISGVRERHSVWLATPDQIRVLDACEGRGRRYELVRLAEGTVLLENGDPVPALAYRGIDTGAADSRAPLYVDGAPVRCAEVHQAATGRLVGVPGPHGLIAQVVDGPV